MLNLEKNWLYLFSPCMNKTRRLDKDQTMAEYPVDVLDYLYLNYKLFRTS
jgi:hypothetical protein